MGHEMAIVLCNPVDSSTIHVAIQSGLLISVFLTKLVCAFCNSPVLATYLSHLILLYFVTLILLAKSSKYSCSSFISICVFVHTASLTLPLACSPRQIMMYTRIHPSTRHPSSSHCIPPRSSIPSETWSTLFLQSREWK